MATARRRWQNGLMRLLIACSTCKLRYDATGRRIGLRFRCRCGEIVTVRRPQGHEADVVHCSACGASREGGVKSCDYCGSDFTIHETDLETICPGCLARVSDRARYCHHCATPLAADVLSGEASELKCPVCAGRRLFSRRLPDAAVTVLECRVCAGMWIGLEAFHELLNAEERRPARPTVTHRPPPAKQQGYRECPHCAGLMTRRNLGRGKSGVVLDVCGEHGLWFDCDELSHALAWTRAGGLEAARQDLARLKRSPDVHRKRQMLEAAEPGGPANRSAAREVLQAVKRGGSLAKLELMAQTLLSIFDFDQD
jgi:hypothetical protein